MCDHLFWKNIGITPWPSKDEVSSSGQGMKLTAVGAFHWVREPCTRIELVGNSHSPPGLVHITLCVLKVVVRLEKKRIKIHSNVTVL